MGLGLKKNMSSLVNRFRSILTIADACDSECHDLVSSKPSQQELSHLLGMDYERFSHLLPYRYYDPEDKLFINSRSLGFGCEIAPLSGANEEIINGIAEAIKEVLDHKTCVQVMLFGSNKVSNCLERPLSGDIVKDDTFQAIEQSNYRYLRHAAVNKFHNKRNINMTLRDYRCFLFVNRRVGYDKYQTTSMKEMRRDLLLELKNVGIPSRLMDDSEMLGLVRDLINVDHKCVSSPQVRVDKYKEMHEQVVDPTFTLTTFPSHIETKIEGGEKTNIVSLSLKKLPPSVALWDQANHFSNVFKQGVGIPCPFVISVHFKCDNPEISKNMAAKKASGYEKKAKSKSYVKIFPNTAETAQDWIEMRKELASETIQLCKVYYNCVLFTDPQNRQEHVSKSLSAFRVNGLDLYSIQYQQVQSYLALMPFVVEQGLWEDLKILGRLNTMTTWNLTNLLPLVADYKGNMSGSGLFSPTFRNQASRIDNFDSSLDNYNVCISATSGSGKSVLAQSMITSVLSDGGKVWVIDIGQSYKKFCETLGGTYLDATNLKLNPFSGVTDISRSAESIRDLLAVMASPNQGLSDVQKSHLLDAVIYSFSQKGRSANIDDVISYLNCLKQNGDHDVRVGDMTILLKKYSPKESQKGSFAARIFNEFSSLTSNDPKKERIVVLELGELESQPDLLKSVLFALILNIEDQMYQGDQKRKKLCVIDEAWRLLSGSNKVAASFIEKGFRTARKHLGAFAIISQRVKDFYASLESQAAWSCSETKIIMRQNEKDFKDFISEHPDYFSEYEEVLIKNFRSSAENGFSEFMVQQGNISRFHRLFLDPFSRIMYSSKAEEHQAVKTLVDQGMSISEAIWEVANQIFGDEISAIKSGSKFNEKEAIGHD